MSEQQLRIQLEIAEAHAKAHINKLRYPPSRNESQESYNERCLNYQVQKLKILRITIANPQISQLLPIHFQLFNDYPAIIQMLLKLGIHYKNQDAWWPESSKKHKQILTVIRSHLLNSSAAIDDISHALRLICSWRC